MRERAEVIGGKLTIWTEMDSGTEVELVIPGTKAYVRMARPVWYSRKRSVPDAGENGVDGVRAQGFAADFTSACSERRRRGVRHARSSRMASIESVRPASKSR